MGAWLGLYVHRYVAVAGFNSPLELTAEPPAIAPSPSSPLRCKQLRLRLPVSRFVRSYESNNAALQAILQAHFESKLEKKFVYCEDRQ